LLGDELAIANPCEVPLHSGDPMCWSYFPPVRELLQLC